MGGTPYPHLILGLGRKKLLKKLLTADPWPSAAIESGTAHQTQCRERRNNCVAETSETPSAGHRNRQPAITARAVEL
jgi:hypothetical protein